MCTLFANLYVLLTWGPHMVYMGTPYIFDIYVIRCGWLGDGSTFIFSCLTLCTARKLFKRKIYLKLSNLQIQEFFGMRRILIFFTTFEKYFSISATFTILYLI